MTTYCHYSHMTICCQYEIRKRTPDGDAFAAFSIAVIRLSAHLQAEGDALAKPAGQTSARWQVLAVANHAPMSVADTARALGLARQGVQRIADLLEGEGARLSIGPIRPISVPS